MNVGMGANDKDRIELPQSAVCCTQRHTDMILVGHFRIKGNPKIYDLICPINVRTRYFYQGEFNLVVTPSFVKQYDGKFNNINLNSPLF